MRYYLLSFLDCQDKTTLFAKLELFTLTLNDTDIFENAKTKTVDTIEDNGLYLFNFNFNFNLLVRTWFRVQLDIIYDSHMII